MILYFERMKREREEEIEIKGLRIMRWVLLLSQFLVIKCIQHICYL